MFNNLVVPFLIIYSVVMAFTIFRLYKREKKNDANVN